MTEYIQQERHDCSINKSVKSTRKETYMMGKKRVELHAHTRMSENDGFNDVSKK